MNILKINNRLVVAEYALLANGGSVLTLLVEAAMEAPGLHGRIHTSLQERFCRDGGIMESGELKNRSRLFPATFFSEIRLIGFTVLKVVDHLRSIGFSVIEDFPE